MINYFILYKKKKNGRLCSSVTLYDYVDNVVIKQIHRLHKDPELIKGTVITAQDAFSVRVFKIEDKLVLLYGDLFMKAFSFDDLLKPEEKASIDASLALLKKETEDSQVDEQQ